MLTLLLAATLLLIGPAAPAPAQSAARTQVVAPGDELPDTPQGRAAAAFIRAINEGSPEAVRNFEENHRASAQRTAVPMEERISRMGRMHADLAPLAITRVFERAGGPLVVVAKAANGLTIRIELVAAPGEPDRVEGVRLAVGGDDVEPQGISPEKVAETVRAAAEALETSYVFPEIGARMAEAAREKLEAGGYASIDSDVALAEALTADFRAISHDLHLGVYLAPPEPAESNGASPRSGVHEMAGDNFGFREVKVLPGNIGYLRFDFFVAGPEAEATGAGAMAFLRDCDAIIYDLRENGGGDPELIRFLTSYLFDTPTHLNDMVDRDGDVVEEFWTLESVPGERPQAGVPVFVLTSPRTGSGAEEFSYNLKNLGRGTIIGEKTWGGAHPIRGERISDRLVINVPFMRARNPISQTNWEGVGVEPDVKVPASEALDRAIELAREAIAASARASR